MDTTALVMDKEDPTEDFRSYFENLFNVKKESTSEAKAAVETWQN